jgi:hypothetical protein
MLNKRGAGMGTDELRYGFLLVGRAFYLSTLWGMGFGGFADVAWGVAVVRDGGLVLLLFIQPACLVGGLVGAASGAVAGLVLALSGRRVIGRMHRARLVTGSAATVVPLLIAWYLYHAQYQLYSTIWPGVVLAVVAAAVTAALLTPRIVNGSPPPRVAYVPLPLPPPVPPVLDTPAPLDDLQPAGISFQRRLIVGRGLGWGFLGGTALGAFTWAVWCLEFGEWKLLALIGFAAALGAAVGACLGLAAGLALALGGSRVARPMYRAQGIAGGMVTAIVLALVRISPVDTLWGFALYLNPSLAVAAALTAMLLTPYIFTGTPQRHNGKRPAAGPGAVGRPGAPR